MLKRLFNNKVFQFSLVFFLIVGIILAFMLKMMFAKCGGCYILHDDNSIVEECSTFPKCIDPDVPIPLTIVILVSIVIYIVSIKIIKNKTNIKELINKFFSKQIKNKKVLFIFIGIVCIITIFCLLSGLFKEKIDVKGNTMLEYSTIVEKYGMDINLDDIDVGANCYTGKQTTVVKSKKYGKVTVEFSYCKSSNSVYIHIYN